MLTVNWAHILHLWDGTNSLYISTWWNEKDSIYDLKFCINSFMTLLQWRYATHPCRCSINKFCIGFTAKFINVPVVQKLIRKFQRTVYHSSTLITSAVARLVSLLCTAFVRFEGPVLVKFDFFLFDRLGFTGLVDILGGGIFCISKPTSSTDSVDACFL